EDVRRVEVVEDAEAEHDVEAAVLLDREVADVVLHQPDSVEAARLGGQTGLFDVGLASLDPEHLGAVQGQLDPVEPLEAGQDDDLAVLDRDRVGLDAHLRVDQALPGRDLELPEVPGAADDLAVALDRVVVDDQRATRGRRVGDDPAEDVAGAERAGLVRAEVAQGVELAVDVEDADAGPAAERDD